MPIPPEIQAQESDIEWMFRQLVKHPHTTQHQSDLAQRQELPIWIPIVILGLLSVFAFYILYLKTSGHGSFLAYTRAPLASAQYKTSAAEP